jgi:hypothetical protein
MVRRGLRQYQAEEFTQRKRIGRPPRNRALGIQALEVTNQQQPEVAPGRQPRSALVRVESLAQSFDVLVKVVPVENLVQSRVEGMRGAPRQVLSRYPHRRLLRAPSSFAHRHRRQCKTCDRSCRSLFVHGSIGRLG